MLGNNPPTLTARALTVLDLARMEAVRAKVGSPTSEHVLVGIALEKGGAAAKLLAHFGLNIDAARRFVTQRPPGSAEYPMDVVLSEAYDCANALGHSKTGTEHLLLAILRLSDPQGLVVQAGLKPEEVRDALLELLGVDTSQGHSDKLGQPVRDARSSDAKPKRVRIPTWLGLLLIALAIVVAGVVGLLLERLTAVRLP
jgi:ATP-dependent Clp protease ATP-binding subunit ClpA